MSKSGIWTEMVEEIGSYFDDTNEGEAARSYNYGLECATSIVNKYKDELLNEETEWLRPDRCHHDALDQMYIAYQPGYPLMIADWQVGRGYRDVRTDVSIQPTYLSRFSPPKI